MKVYICIKKRASIPLAPCISTLCGAPYTSVETVVYGTHSGWCWWERSKVARELEYKVFCLDLLILNKVLVKEAQNDFFSCFSWLVMSICYSSSIYALLYMYIRGGRVRNLFRYVHFRNLRNKENCCGCALWSAVSWLRNCACALRNKAADLTSTMHNFILIIIYNYQAELL